MNSNRSVVVHLVVAATCVMITGCAGTEQRKLLVSEVGTTALELYLDEPPTNAMTLGSGLKLSFSSAMGASHTIDLGAFGGSITGGSFLIIWESGNYQGLPVAEPFSGGQTGAVPGIKVAHGLLTDFRTLPSEVKLSGSRNRVSGLLAIFPLFKTDVIDDVVRFGTPVPDRPDSGGTFVPAADPSLILDNPSGSVHLQRRWNGSAGPVDTDNEADWQKLGQSWGVVTP
jgi:hypothetical protein